MGDALATYFEARACQVSGATTCAGGQVTQEAIALAKLCFDTLMAEGVKAKLASWRESRIWNDYTVCAAIKAADAYGKYFLGE